MTYKSHNTLIQNFCLKVNALTLSVLGNKKQKPLLVFDRGFARAQYVIELSQVKAHRLRHAYLSQRWHHPPREHKET